LIIGIWISRSFSAFMDNYGEVDRGHNYLRLGLDNCVSEMHETKIGMENNTLSIKDDSCACGHNRPEL